MNHNSDPVLELENVGVAYRRRVGIFRSEKYWALKNISLELLKGETIGVVGRNGVGKSTLLLTIAGIISPDVGCVRNYGVTVSLLSLQVGFLPNLSGRENAILSGMLLGLSKSQIVSKIDDIKNFSEIGEFFDQPVKTYSSGMRARLGFSVAYHANSDVILIDEVLGVGDVSFRNKSRDAIKSLIDSDRSVILVAHQPSVIKESCHRLVWIEDGTVRAFGDVDDVLREYQLSFSEKLHSNSF